MPNRKKPKKRVAARKATTSKRSKFHSDHFESNISWDLVAQQHIVAVKIVPNSTNPIEPDIKRIIGKIKI